ncbi:MAG: zinc-ribbon domain-containing protein [Holosporales bacterium]|jgi:hypothetical protein|nr:zinc-ribbon domain-containing protein [Holosporales bacterium]
MNVKCPYCGCSYSIDPDALPKALGDEKLGYGWWLRCCKCHKKWWLPNHDVQLVNSPKLVASLVASKEEIPLKPVDKDNSLKKFRFGTYAFIILGTFLVMFLAYNINTIKVLVIKKTEYLLSTVLVKLKVLNVQYSMETVQDDPDSVAINVNGKILNEDRSVLQISGVKVSIYGSNNEIITTWTDNLNKNYIMSGESLDFSTRRVIKRTNDQIKVDISILQR